MASSRPSRGAALAWTFLLAVGASNLLEGHTISGIGLLIAGSCRTTGELTNHRYPTQARILKILGIAGGVVALIGIGVNEF